MVLPEIELMIKASDLNENRKGACLFCQEYFMDLFLLAEMQKIALRITIIDTGRPPDDFRSKFGTTPLPILIDGETAIIENEKIEQHIRTNIPGSHNLFTQSREVLELIQNVYSKFKVVLLKKDDASKRALLAQLLKINNHLESNDSVRFLAGDTLCSSDCELMPKLQHIRVAGAALADFNIPTELPALWSYFGEMYKLAAFVQSCPFDQDIINHYKQQKGAMPTRREKLEVPTFTDTVPPLETNL